jgi:hypothetical protein
MVRTQAHGRLHRMHKKKKIGADRHATMHVFAWCVSTGCSPAMPSGEGFSTVYADTDCVLPSSPLSRFQPPSLKLEQSRVETFQTNSRLVHASGRTGSQRLNSATADISPDTSPPSRKFILVCTGAPDRVRECRVRIVRLRWNGYGGRTGENDHGVHELWLHNFTHQYPPLALSRQGRWG